MTTLVPRPVEGGRGKSFCCSVSTIPRRPRECIVMKAAPKPPAWAILAMKSRRVRGMEWWVAFLVASFQFLLWASEFYCFCSGNFADVHRVFSLSIFILVSEYFFRLR